MGDRTRYMNLLGSHLGFIDRASKLYDHGQEDESLNVSNSLRTIFHDKGRTTSLLSHLNVKSSAQMLSTSRGYGDWQYYLSIVVDFNSSRPVAMKPILGDTFTPVALLDWWEGETIFVHDGVSYTRRRIVLSVAEKDGGTHVDEDLEPYYEVLLAGEYSMGITAVTCDGPPPFPQGVTIYPDNAHLALIRQFGHEALASHRRFKWPILK